MSYVIDTLTSFNKTLGGNDAKALGRFIRKNDRYGKDIARNFHKIQLDEELSNTGLTDIIIQILLKLGIPKYQWGRYIGSSMSVYQFLLEVNELTHKKITPLQDLIGYIDTKMGSFWYTLLAALIFSLLLATIFLPFFIQSQVLSIITEIVTAVLFIPALRIIYNAGCALYSFYAGIFDTHIPFRHRFRDHFFTISSAVIEIAASSIVFVAVAMSPIVSILLVTATALSVIKEAISFIQLFIERKNKHPMENEDPLMRRQHQARLDNAFKKTRNDLITNIVAAILITVIVGVWTFIPGGIPLIVGAISAMAVIHITKTLVRTYNEKNKKKELLDTFEQLETAEREKELSYNEQADSEDSMTYANLQAKLGEPRSRLTVVEPLSINHYEPLFQACGGNEREKRDAKNETALSASTYC